MNFNNYAAFRTGVQQLLDGDDISVSDLSTGVLDLLIGAGERRLYREVRSSAMDTALSLTVSGNSVALPSDFVELKGAPYVTGSSTTIYAPWEAFQNMTQSNPSNSVKACYYTFEGDNILVYPAANAVTITGRYYKRFADIAGGTLNAFFIRHPDLFLFAALSVSASFVGELGRLPIWEQTYTSLATAVNEEERRRVTRGSKLQTRIA